MGLSVGTGTSLCGKIVRDAWVVHVQLPSLDVLYLREQSWELEPERIDCHRSPIGRARRKRQDKSSFSSLWSPSRHQRGDSEVNA